MRYIYDFTNLMLEQFLYDLEMIIRANATKTTIELEGRNLIGIDFFSALAKQSEQIVS